MARRMFRRISHAELVFRRVKAMDQREVYAGLLSVMRLKDRQRGWVAHKFKALFGDWPAFDDVEPGEASTDLLSWLSREATNWRNKIRREEDKLHAGNAKRLAHIEVIVAEIETADRESAGAYRQDTDREALEIAERVVADLESRLIPQTGGYDTLQERDMDRPTLIDRLEAAE